MMKGWKTDKLMNLVSSITTGKLDANAMVPNGQYRFYTCAKEYYFIDKYAFDDEALLISGNGEYVGYIHYYKGKFNAYQRVYVLTGFKIDVKYLQNYLNRYLPIRINKEVSQNNIPYIRLSTLSKMDIKYPESPNEQTAIANILSKVDEAIAAVQGSIAAAERLKKSLMQNLLTGRMKPDGTLRKEDEFYMDEKFGKVPKEWHWGKLSEVAEIIAGQSPQGEFYNDEGVGTPMLNGPTEFTDEYPIPVQWTKKVTKLCKKGDILFTVRGSSTGRMNFADQEYCIGRGLAAIRPKHDGNIQFLYYTLTRISEMILAEAKGAGTTFPNVSRGDLLKKVILIPTNQNEIIQPIVEIACLIKSKQQKITILERLKKSLMQNLLTGRVRVNVQCTM